MITAIIIISAYILGSIPSGLIIGKVFYKTDIREHGSGNLGGTNTFRTLGIKAGLIVTIMDIIKGTVATQIPNLFDFSEIYMLLAGVIAVVGHMYPIFANFRGGKAVATSGGVILGYAPLLFIVALTVFFLCLYLTKYVSLSSMLTALIALIYSLFTGDIPLIIVMGALSTFVFYRHRANIMRIRNKTEPKIKWL
ncbi:glycerol-3-phosphate acyltransferase PlsY [Bacillus pakistanensis]|uniref:Glycerol-3-phosphate acyltransferase n=1 Tax=Rossellomorea pakistanensis TaxID=992288 RepID=A0ABS2N7U9_9BACI|nr:glycerol-3-phosphate 1-O-acyltransferase PlsY [Bacillus pakistanensis]MBM7583899.1 glycerol-3-phosphate acyltransferase PlsY [Bacillus pakistanensis]